MNDDVKQNEGMSDFSQGDWFYSEKVKEHFFHPKNFMTEEDEKNYQADGVGIVGSPACGDMMKLWIKVDPQTKRILDCRWRTYGCASAIAATSILSEMIIKDGGMTLDEAEKITPQDIMKELGGLPAIKVHCSILGDQALREAIKDYREKHPK